MPGQFSVVIIGGGPVGLTAAHSLSKAGIGFVVLERRAAIVEDVGASFVLEPRSLRVLAQLELLSQVLAISSDVEGQSTMTRQGVLYAESPLLGLNKEYLGCKVVAVHRADFLRILYDGLGESKSSVLTNKRVADIASSEAGVSVFCADGSRYEGSIVVGADGVHSQVRHLMRALALGNSPLAQVNPDEPFLSEYRLLWCSFPRKPSSRVGWDCQTHGRHFSAQHLVAAHRAWAFLYERLDEPTRGQVTYTQEDMVSFAERYGDTPIGPDLRIRDAFRQRERAGMANIEEGIVAYWSWERLVLVGDAAHKMTPIIGQGYNNGVQDVVVLTNELHRLLGSHEGDIAYEGWRCHHPEDGKGHVVPCQPGMQELASAFRRYQAARIDETTADFQLSARITRLSAWRNPIYWLIDRWLLPHLPSWVERILYEKTQAERHGTGQVLTFVKRQEPFTGSHPWKYSMSGE
ncbi:hypothetical protein GGS20DRAFT_540890 [Poronia punctata]|nr:hypothetical protein GGS20DRAFT_540890 [Poronia punctata]